MLLHCLDIIYYFLMLKYKGFKSFIKFPIQLKVSYDTLLIILKRNKKESEGGGEHKDSNRVTDGDDLSKRHLLAL